MTLVPADSAVEGTVTDAGSGDPVQDVEVEIVNGTGGNGSAQTDENGFYRVEELGEGDWTATFWSPDHGTVEEEIHLGAGSTLTLDVELKPIVRRTVEGTVRNESGKPVPNARIDFLAVTEHGLIGGANGTTDAAGRYSIDVEVGQDYTVAPG